MVRSLGRFLKNRIVRQARRLSGTLCAGLAPTTLRWRARNGFSKNLLNAWKRPLRLRQLSWLGGERLHSLSQEPETPGHEKLFMERLGYDRLRSRLMTRAVHHLGKVLADEINQGRRVRAIIDEIVKAKDCSTLVISRRAKRFRDECDSHGAHVAINKAAKQADLSMDAAEFNQLIEAACQRDQGACRELGRTAELLRPHLRGKSGRALSRRHQLVGRWWTR